MHETPRQIAKRKGHLTYMGRMCRNCHGRERYASNMACRACHLDKEKAPVLPRAENPRHEATRQGAMFYKGAACHNCEYRLRYASNGACVRCTRMRALPYASRQALPPSDLADLRNRERMAKRAQRAKARITQSPSPWHITIQSLLD